MSSTYKTRYENKSSLRIFGVLAIFFLVALSIIQIMPVIREFYSFSRLLLYFGFGILALISFFNFKKLKTNFVIKLFLINAILVLAFVIISFLNLGNNITFEFVELVVPLGILITSMRIQLSIKEIKMLMGLYVLLALLLGIMSVYYYGEGFRLLSTYFLLGKNQIGPILGIAAVIAFHHFAFESNFNSNKDKILAFLSIASFIILFSLIVLILNRTGMFALIIVAPLMLLKKEYKVLKYKLVIVYSLFFAMLPVIFYFAYISQLHIAILTALGRGSGFVDLNQFTAGRISEYLDAFNFLLENPFFGGLAELNKMYGVPHNYILNKWFQFGFIFSLPLILMYCYFWKISLSKTILSKKSFGLDRVVYWILLFSMIVSLAEYSYPYGPGSSQIMLWFLLGQKLTIIQNH